MGRQLARATPQIKDAFGILGKVDTEIAIICPAVFQIVKTGQLGIVIKVAWC